MRQRRGETLGQETEVAGPKIEKNNSALEITSYCEAHPPFVVNDAPEFSFFGAFFVVEGWVGCEECVILGGRWRFRDWSKRPLTDLSSTSCQNFVDSNGFLAIP